MSNNTRIEWTDATWNPVSGCTKVSTGCKHCYAERDWNRLVNNPKTPRYHGRAFTDVQCHPEMLDQPLRWRRPRRIFVNSMSDLFHEDVPFEFIDRVFSVMQCRRHTFQILTKRPARMLEWFASVRRYEHSDGSVFHLGRNDLIVGGEDWPLPNVWLGVTAENQEAADERILLLLQAPAAVRFVSVEPMVGPISFRWSKWDRGEPHSRRKTQAPAVERGGKTIAGSVNHLDGLRMLDWIICGGESGTKARPTHPDWVRALRDQCAEAEVPFLFKQWGEFAPVIDYYSDDDAARDAALDKPYTLITRKGCTWDENEGQPPDCWIMHRVGKKAAGRLLDGREHLEYPEPKA